MAFGKSRSVSLMLFVKKTNEATVTAVVSRAKDEKVTHIALTWVDNKSQ